MGFRTQHLLTVFKPLFLRPVSTDVALLISCLAEYQPEGQDPVSASPIAVPKHKVSPQSAHQNTRVLSRSMLQGLGQTMTPRSWAAILL